MCECVWGRGLPTIVPGALQNQGRAGHPTANAGEGQDLQLIQHEFAQPSQQCRASQVALHHQATLLSVQVPGPEKHLWGQVWHGQGDEGCEI